MKQADELGLFGKKGIMAVGSDHLAVVCPDADRTHGFGQLLDVVGGKKQV